MNYKDILDTESSYNRFNKFKILAHAENIERLLNNEKPKPIVVDLELSNYCNQNCIWCEPMAFRMKNLSMLKPEIIKQAVDDIVKLGAKFIRFCGGGEPMTNSFYWQAIQYAKEKGLGIISNSNGSLLHKNIDIIVDYCDYFRVSLDAATEMMYNKLHQPKNFEDFNNIVDGLSTLMTKRNEKASKLEVGTAFLIHYENYKEILKFTKLMLEIGVDFVHFRPVYLASAAENEKLVNIIDKALEIVAICKHEFESINFKVCGITRKMGGVWHKRKWKNCYSPFFLPVLGADGNIYACCDRRDLCLGSFTTERFAEIYYSKNYLNKVKAINVDKCIRCSNSDLNEVIYYCFEQDYLRRDIL